MLLLRFESFLGEPFFFCGLLLWGERGNARLFGCGLFRLLGLVGMRTSPTKNCSQENKSEEAGHQFREQACAFDLRTTVRALRGGLANLMAALFTVGQCHFLSLILCLLERE